MTITVTISVTEAGELPRILRQLSAQFSDTIAAAECAPLPGTRDSNVLTPDEAEQPKRGRGRPRKAAEPTATSDEFPAEVEVPVASPKAAEPPAPTDTVVDAAMLRHTLIEVVKQHGRDVCGELCRKHGGPNLSALDPKVYPAIYADAIKLLGTEPSQDAG